MEGTAENRKKPERRKAIIQRLIMLVVLIGIAGGVGMLFLSVQSQAAEEEEETVLIQGSLKTEEVNLNSKIAGTVKEVTVSEGQKVQAGDILIVMDSDTLQTKRAQAEAALSEARAQNSVAAAQYEKVKAGASQEEIDQAKAALDLAASTYERLSPLYEEEIISASTFDEVDTQYKLAQAKYEQVINGARQEDLSIAKANVDLTSSTVARAEGALAEVDSYLDDSVIKAPANGKIVSINVNPGELVSTGMPLVTIMTEDEPYVEVNVPEVDLANVHVGGEAVISFLAYPDETFIGEVVRVNQQADFAVKRATNDNGSFDIVSYGVKVKLPSLGDKELYPGMTVLVDFSYEEK